MKRINTGIMLLFFHATVVVNAVEKKVSPATVCVIGHTRSQSVGMGTVEWSLEHYLGDSLSFDFPVEESWKFLTPETAGKRYDVLFMVKTLDDFFPGLTGYKNEDLATVKIASSVVEMSAVSPKQVELLNTYFDSVVVPDPYLVGVYRTSGVTIPIFCIPQGTLVEDFITPEMKQLIDRHEGKRDPEEPFTFGIVARNHYYKNIRKVMEAFYNEFHNDPAFRLNVHCRKEEFSFENFEFLEELGAKTIYITEDDRTRSEYLAFMKELDCYILVSQGEGFSITPREAMALGIPCILSNNTTHKTLCKTGYVLPVECDIIVPSFYTPLLEFVGYKFDCYLEDVQAAMRTMYEEYDMYYAKAKDGIEWARQFDWKRITPLYKTLLQPLSVKKGAVNAIEGDCLITNSDVLFEKYNRALARQFV